MLLLRTIFNQSWKQHPPKQQLYDHLPPISLIIKVWRVRHVWVCWRSKDELISGVLQWTPPWLTRKNISSIRTLDAVIVLTKCDGIYRESKESVLSIQLDDDDDDDETMKNFANTENLASFEGLRETYFYNGINCLYCHFDKRIQHFCQRQQIYYIAKVVFVARFIYRRILVSHGWFSTTYSFFDS